jgi:hypothetical protein
MYKKQNEKKPWFMRKKKLHVPFKPAHVQNECHMLLRENANFIGAESSCHPVLTYIVKLVLRGHLWEKAKVVLLRKKKLHVPFKPAHEVTSLKQSQVLKGHPFLVLT